MKRVLFLFIAISLFGCYTQKKAEKSLNKAQINFPELVAEKSALWYPCSQIKGISDSSQYKSFIKQIDSLNRLKIDSIYFVDTIHRFDTLVKLKDCKDVIYKYKILYKSAPVIHDTVIKVSTAEKYTIKYLENDREEAHKRYDNSTKLNIWLLIALLISMFVHFFRSIYK